LPVFFGDFGVVAYRHHFNECPKVRVLIERGFLVIAGESSRRLVARVSGVVATGPDFIRSRLWAQGTVQPGVEEFRG